MITEQQVREVFALIAETRRRWIKETDYGYRDRFVYLDCHALVFTDGYSESEDDWEYMRLAALFDYDAIAAPYIKAKREGDERAERQREETRRKQYEQLRQEFGEA